MIEQVTMPFPILIDNRYNRCDNCNSIKDILYCGICKKETTDIDYQFECIDCGTCLCEWNCTCQ